MSKVTTRYVCGHVNDSVIFGVNPEKKYKVFINGDQFNAGDCKKITAVRIVVPLYDCSMEVFDFITDGMFYTDHEECVLIFNDHNQMGAYFVL